MEINVFTFKLLSCKEKRLDQYDNHPRATCVTSAHKQLGRAGVGVGVGVWIFAVSELNTEESLGTCKVG